MEKKNEVNIRKNYGTVNDNVTFNIYQYYESPENTDNENSHYKLPSKYKLFTGRTDEISLIEKLLEKTDLIILRGIGGVGKTQITKELVMKNLESFDIILWLNATNEIELCNEFRQIARYYGLSININDADSSLVIEIVKNYIMKYNRALIVFDGLDDLEPHCIKKYIPTKNTKVLMSTQNAIYDDEIFDVIEIKDFKDCDAINLIINNTKNRALSSTDDSDIKKLVRLLYNYPLAIEHARAYINKNGITIGEYITLFTNENVDIFSNKLSEYELTVLTTFKISLDKAIETENYSYELLGLSSLMNLNEIPYKTILENEKYVEKKVFRNALEALLNYSLLDVKGNYFFLHGIIQANMQNRLKNDYNYESFVKSLYERIVEKTPEIISCEEDRDLARDLLPHIEYFTKLAVHIAELEEKAFDLMISLGHLLYNFGEYQKAIEIMQVIYSLTKKIENYVFEIAALDSLGITYHYVGKPKESFEYVFKAKQLLDQHNIENQKKWWHKMNSSIHGNLGIMYKVQGDSDKSLECYQIALKSANILDDSELIINQLNNIGINYKNRGEYETAIKYYDTAIDIPCSNERLERKAYSNKGVALRLLGDHKNAIIIFEKDVSKARKIGDVRAECIGLYNLGICKFTCPEKDETLKLFEDALKLADKIDLLTTKSDLLLWLGLTFRDLFEDKQKSETYFQQSYDLAIETGNHMIVDFINSNNIPVN